MSTNEIPLHVQQAADLRKLAEMVENHPEIADHMSFALRTMDNYIVRGDARAPLRAFHAAGLATGGDVSIADSGIRCLVKVVFGVVTVTLSADADLMAGVTPKPKYAPLFEDTSAVTR